MCGSRCALWGQGLDPWDVPLASSAQSKSIKSPFLSEHQFLHLSREAGVLLREQL